MCLAPKAQRPAPVRHRTDSPWRTWGNAPGIRGIPKEQALKARFTLGYVWIEDQRLDESRVQRLFTARSVPGTMSQAKNEIAPLALNSYGARRAGKTTRHRPRLTTRAVSLSRARCYFCLEIMKKRLRHRVRVIAILFGFAIAIGPTPFTMAAGKNEARITQAIHNVQLLAPKAAPRAASVNGNIPPDTAVRTGSDSRAELTFTNRTLARLGANSVFSFGEREFDLASGSMLLYTPKNSGGARINTAVATIAGNSFTAMAEYRPKSWLRFIILEGRGSVSLKHDPGETRTLHAGQMIVVRADATKLPEPQNVDLSELIKTSLLVTQFPRLPNLTLILAEANNQQISPPSTRVIDPTGLEARDQRAATERERTSKPRFN